MMDLRINRLREEIKKQGIDALLVSNFYNIFYLTGFKTLTENEREAFVIITQDKIYLITDGRYIKNSKSQIPSSKQIPNSKLEIKLITPEKKLIQHLKEMVGYEDIGRLGIESEDVRFSEYLNLRNELEVEIVPIYRLIVRLREIKDSQEIEYVKKACEIGDKCLGEIIKIIKLGQTEKEIAWKMERWIREKGYEIAFEPIVAVDQNSAIPHYNTKEGKTKIKKDSLILIDFGVKYKNYCSDITRMLLVGKPKDEIRNVYEGLLKAQNDTIEMLKPNFAKASLGERVQHDKFPLNEIDRYCRLLITDYRLPVYPHSTGHGVGLEVHEYPKVSPHSEDLLKAGQIFTIEPGVYFQGKWGMRIEDTITIDDKLKPIVLTKFSKQLFVI